VYVLPYMWVSAALHAAHAKEAQISVCLSTWNSGYVIPSCVIPSHSSTFVILSLLYYLFHTVCIQVHEEDIG